MRRAALVAIVVASLGACGDQEWSFDDAAADAPGAAPADAQVDASGEASGEASGDAPGDAPGDTSRDASNGGCSSDADCIITELHCDTMPGQWSGQCVECVNTTQCPSGEMCDTRTSGPSSQRCIDCYVNTDCPSGQVCAPTNDCVPSCMSDRDCLQPDLPHCSPHHLCVGCLSSSDCSTMTGTTQIMGTCDPAIDQCAECMSDLDCQIGVCDRTTDRCVGCITGLNCRPNEVCAPWHECVGPDAGASFARSGDATDESRSFRSD